MYMCCTYIYAQIYTYWFFPLCIYSSPFISNHWSFFSLSSLPYRLIELAPLSLSLSLYFKYSSFLSLPLSLFAVSYSATLILRPLSIAAWWTQRGNTYVMPRPHQIIARRRDYALIPRCWCSWRQPTRDWAGTLPSCWSTTASSKCDTSGEGKEELKRKHRQLARTNLHNCDEKAASRCNYCKPK